MRDCSGSWCPISATLFVALIHAVETLAWRDGRRVILCNSDEDPRREVRFLSILEDERVSGIVIAPAISSTSPETVVPTVLVDRGFPGSGHDMVMLDNAGAAEALVDSLAAEGSHRMLGLFGAWGMTAEERRRRFVDRTARHGMPSSTIAMPHDRAARRALVRDAIDASKADAIVCGDSVILLDAAITLQGIGRDVRLAGFDQTEWLSLIPSSPTMIAQPVEEIAHAALALLTSRMAGDEGDPITVTFSGRIA